MGGHAWSSYGVRVPGGICVTPPTGRENIYVKLALKRIVSNTYSTVYLLPVGIVLQSKSEILLFFDFNAKCIIFRVLEDNAFRKHPHK